MISPRITLASLLLALLTQLTACSDSDNQSSEEKSAGSGRMFNTQRESLEQAKAVADFANQRNEQFEQKSQELDIGTD